MPQRKTHRLALQLYELLRRDVHHRIGAFTWEHHTVKCLL